MLYKFEPLSLKVAHGLQLLNESSSTPIFIKIKVMIVVKGISHGRKVKRDLPRASRSPSSASLMQLLKLLPGLLTAWKPGGLHSLDSVTSDREASLARLRSTPGVRTQTSGPAAEEVQKGAQRGQSAAEKRRDGPPHTA